MYYWPSLWRSDPPKAGFDGSVCCGTVARAGTLRGVELTEWQNAKTHTQEITAKTGCPVDQMKPEIKLAAAI